MPNQLFVKNFLSFQTPYNSLLLYNGLGTGKTCSAIGIAEEMRSYMKQVGIVSQKNNKIIVVASPNVQANFRVQLFDDSKLKEENGLWNLNTCIGTALLKEINPTSLKGLAKEVVISQINNIINNYYIFMGYIELANYITKKIIISDESGLNEKDKKDREIKKIKKIFNNRLIVIDEVHNIRMTDDNKDKRTADLLMKVARHSDNLRLLLLSATPMYNSYKEIIWLVNLMNINDKRAPISLDDVFNKEGNFKESKTLQNGEKTEDGRELLIRKLTGYISYVRGENPYTFPYRIYPTIFSPENSITTDKYPKIQMNKKPIDEFLEHVPVYTSRMGTYQQNGYDFIMNNMRQKSFNRINAYGEETIMPTFENMESFGYTLLQIPLESLNIVYPSSQLDEKISKKIISNQENTNEIPEPQEVPEEEYNQEENNEIIANSVGKIGLSNIMNYKTIESPQPLRYDFEYKPEILSNENHGRIFSKEKIGNYSNKISNICDCVLKSKGIVMIYSLYIDGGVVPIALALEELGFTRYGTAQHTKPLLKNPNVEPIDALTMKPKSQVEGPFKQAKYVMITGDKYFSPNNAADIKQIVKSENKDGELVKVVLISKAASEGLDFKNIRQIHILEPWYNMNRTEQIIGRGVRNLSHCQLPFKERNVEIYLHATLPNNENAEEPADLYVYRLAEKKAKQIGKITRILKETAVDCLLNIGQTNFTVEKLLSLAQNNNIKIQLSSGIEVDYKIGDKPFTDICDYMDNCSFTCSPNVEINETDIIKDTYSDEFVKMNYSMILKRIRQLFREQTFYKKEQLFSSINIVKKYPDEQIYYVLTQFIENKNEFLLDRYGRKGYLTNRGEFYMFQPVEITDENASIFERSAPVDYKNETMKLLLHKETETVSDENTMTYEQLLEDINQNIKNALLDADADFGSNETDWYKNASKVIEILRNDHEIPMEQIIKYIYFHYLDSLSFTEKQTIISKIYSDNFVVNNENESNIKTYFDNKIVEYTKNNKKLRSIVLANEEQVKIYIQSNENSESWNEATYTDKQKLGQLIIDKFIFSPNEYNTIIGFMNAFKNRDIVFKIKDMRQKRNNKGARLDNAGKSDIIKRLNELLDEKIYNDVNTKNILKIGLCVIMEILMRYYDENGLKNDKICFLDIEEAILNNINVTKN